MASIKDVAMRAGVSNATVSRVLTNKPHVSDKIRRRVLEAVEALNYQPDQTAQRLRAQTTSKVIGLLLAGIHNPHFSEIIHGVSDLAYSQQMYLILCNTEGSAERQRYYIDLMRSERAAGLIINPTNNPNARQQLSELRASGVAVVLLDNYVTGGDFDVVQVDSRRGALKAVRHLIALGHRRIGTITGPLATTTTAQERLQGYLDALAEGGIAVDDALIREGDYEREPAYGRTLELLDMANPPSAIFASNNLTTLGVLDALHQRGVRVPQEIALVGFDDVPWAPHLNPPLTTVAQPTYALGREAVRLLLRRINEPDALPIDVRLAAELVVRGSCGAQPDAAFHPRLT